MYLRNLFYEDLDVLLRFSRSVKSDLFLKYAADLEQAKDMKNAFSKIDKELTEILPPVGGGNFFDKDYPDGTLSFEIFLSINERIALANFSKNIDFESLLDHFGDALMAKNMMQSMQSILDSLLWNEVFDDEGNLKI
ncbi:hypothetical protein MCEMAEM21_00156 [Oxalobacteraceae bacterium]